MNKKKSKIENNLIVLSFLLSLIFFGGIYAFYSSEKKSISQSKEGTLKLMADFKITQISEWYSDEVADIQAISDDEELSALIKIELKDADDKSKKHLARYFNQMKTEHYYSDVLLLDPEGRVLVSASDRVQKLDSIELKRLQKALKDKRSQNTDLFRYSYDYKVYIDFIAPFVDKNGKGIAGVICRKDLDEYINSLISLSVSEKTAETYLVKKDSLSNIYIYKTENSVLSEKNCWFAASEKDEPTLKAASGHVGIVYGKDDNEISVGSYVSPIPNTPWSIVEKAHKSELFNELYTKAGASVVIAILMLIVLIIGINLIYVERRQKYYIRSLAKEVELRQYQERFKATMDILGEGIITTDWFGKINYMNLRAEALTEWNMDDATDKNLNEVFRIKNEMTGRFEYDLPELMKGEGAYNKIRNTILISKRGKEIPVDCFLTSMKSKENKEEGYIITFEDVTENRIKAKLLQLSEASYKNLFENNPLPMWVYEIEKLRFLSVNNTAVQKYGFTREEFLTMSLRDILPEKDAKAFDQDLETMKSGQSASVCRHKLKNGKIIHVEIASHTIKYGLMDARLVLANDVTKTVKYESELIIAKEKAEESERLKSAFLANMSHEIRTPLNGIIGFAQILNEENLESGKVKQYSGYIVDGGRRLLELLNNILNFSKIESGAEELNLRECMVSDFVRTVYNQFIFQAKSKNIDYKLIIPVHGQDLKLVTDTVKLGQILTNFLSNAFKFTPNGFIELGYTFDESEVKFYVRDSGQGIQTDQQDLIFGRFYQIDSSLSNGYEGAGLGLAICKGFSMLMGGEIHVDSVPGEGSVFYLSLPLLGNKTLF